MKNLVLITLVFICIISNAQDILVPYKKASFWGFSDTNGKIIIEPVYDSVVLFESVYDRKKEAFVYFSKVFKDKKVGILSKSNTFIFPIGYSDIQMELNSDRCIVTDTSGKVGLVDFNNTILQFEYESIKSIKHDYYLVEKKGKIGLLDYDGKILIPIIYNQLDLISEDEKLCKWKVINEKETKYLYTSLASKNQEDDEDFDVPFQIIPKRKDNDEASYENIPKKYIIYKKHNKYNYAIIFKKEYMDGNKYVSKYGFINAKSKNTFKDKDAILEFLYDYYDEKTLSQHFILLIKENGKTGIIDESGKMIVPSIYKNLNYNSEYFSLKLEDSLGFYFPKYHQYFEPKFKGIKCEYHVSNFFILGVYEKTRKDWYYIGENGVVFKE
jgi:hypothetical protein